MSLKTWRLVVLVFEMALAFSTVAFAQTPQLTPITIDETIVPIRVDGHLSDWPAARMILLNRKSQITYGKAYWKGEEDFSGRVFLTYDEQYLYVSAIVEKKSKKAVNGNDKLSLPNGDCLELFLSTNPHFDQESRLSRGDYHIAFSPGKDCKNPQMYCLNKDTDIPGGRINARNTLKGYLMEICIPLAFFKGLNLAQGKSAGFDLVLDEGGEVSGYRIVQLDYAGDSSDPENPSTWSKLQWIGKIEQSVPLEQSQDLYSGLVSDGTKGDTYAGYRVVQGNVLDTLGKPLAGAKVTTWPKTQEAFTDALGHFETKNIKVYGQTVFYACKDGYTSSLAEIPSKGKPATLFLSPLPAEFKSLKDQVGPFFIGLTLPTGSPDRFNSTLSAIQDWVKPMNPGLIRLQAPLSAFTPEECAAVLDEFIAYTRQLGAEPMVTVPLDPQNLQIGADWVRYCNVEKQYKIRYWAIGDEPDSGNNLEPGKYNAYDYINNYRELYNAMKRVDPSLFILGPELISKYTEGEDDWVTPFLQYNGDIVNGISIHRYAVSKAVSLTSQSLLEDLRHEAAVLQAVRDKISENSDLNIPLVVTGGKACSEGVTAKTKEEATRVDFWCALWEADKKGIDLNQGLPMDISSSLLPEPLNGSPVSFQPNPSYWALRLWSLMSRGKVITTVVQKPDISVYATQDPRSRDVTLMIINKGDNYWRPNILLNGKATDLMVDAGLDQRYDFEIPSFSISRLKMRSDRTSGEALVYTLKMAQAGKEPQESSLKPW
jgi:hypothetical protein